MYAAPLLASATNGLQYGMQSTTTTSPPPSANHHHSSANDVLSAANGSNISCGQSNHNGSTAALATTNAANSSNNNLTETHSNTEDYGSPKSTQNGVTGAGGSGGALPAFQRIAATSYNQNAHATTGVDRYSSLNNYRTHVSY